MNTKTRNPSDYRPILLFNQHGSIEALPIHEPHPGVVLRTSNFSPDVQASIVLHLCLLEVIELHGILGNIIKELT